MTFHEELTKDFNKMLEVRSALGYATFTDESMLPRFIGYCGTNYPNAQAITKKMVDSWLVDHHYKSVNTQAIFISLLRHYTKFIRFLGKESFIPDEEYTIHRESYRPYIFDNRELTILFHAIDSITPHHKTPKREKILPVLFRMMYCCGMRPSEPLRLLVEDVNLETGDIYIRKSKKNKDRHIIMSEDLRLLCIKYDFLLGQREYFFQHWNGGPFSTQWMTKQFHICWDKSKLVKRGNPRPYDVRHVFATRNIMRWIDNGVDIMSLLPYLSIYMGHSNFKSTLYYIHLLPERLRKSPGVDWKQLSYLNGEE